MLLVEGIPRQSVDRWNVGIKYSPLKRVLPVRYSRTWNLKTAAFRCRVNGKHFENKVLEQ